MVNNVDLERLNNGVNDDNLVILFDKLFHDRVIYDPIVNTWWFCNDNNIWVIDYNSAIMEVKMKTDLLSYIEKYYFDKFIIILQIRMMKKNLKCMEKH